MEAMPVDESERYRVTRARRTLNALIGELVSFGLGPPGTHLLTTRGNRTGFLRTTPVDLLEDEAGRFLVAPYGAVGWVRNIRAEGFATLRRGGWIELVTVEEVGAEQAARVLRAYLDDRLRAAVVGRHFAIPAGAPLEDFVRIAPSHPVFTVVRSTTVRI